jgi:hypothetical protein
MTHVGCPSCRLRFTPAAAAYLVSCPECGLPLSPSASAESLVGFSVFVPEELARAREASAVPIPIGDPGGWRS